MASSKYRQEMVSAIAKELVLQQNYLKSSPIETIYIGGGTPTVLSIDELNLVLDTVFENYSVNADAEITIEANPDDLDHSKIQQLRKSPINRLSIGIQSFFEKDLYYLNRIHSAKQAEYAIKASQDAGFENLSIDLIYGIPTLSDQLWQENLHKAISFHVPHISAYSLTVEPSTPLDILIKKGKLQNIDEEQQVRHFETAMKTMDAEGYIHYEISNFCKEGFYSKHNSNYWKQKPYLGIGPSAHSYNVDSRQWNIANIREYTTSIAKNIIPFEKEELDLNTRYNEYILTRLRTMWGCDPKEIQNEFGEDLLKHFKDKVFSQIEKENITENKEIYLLTQRGKLFADAVSADLFI
jgi:oxygen-independent coproporphyrinogen III oxidase